MLLMLFTTFFLLWMIHHWLSLRKLLNLPSPGICLPVFGHFYLFMNSSARKDPVGCLSKLWKTHQKGGVLWFRRLAADILLVGDLNVAKQLFNHPSMQGRSVHNSAMKNQFLENRGTPGNQVQGVLLPPKLQRRGLVFLVNWVTMERLWWVTMERINGYFGALVMGYYGCVLRVTMERVW